MIEELFKYFSNMNEETIRFTIVFGIIFISQMLAFISRKVLLRMADRASTSSNTWDDAVVYAVRKPVRIIIWVLGISLAAEFIEIEDEKFASAIMMFRELGIIFALGMFGYRFVDHVEENLLDNLGGKKKEVKLDQTTLQAMTKIGKISVVISVGLVMLQTMGISIAGILAFGGVGGVAVGFAAKDLLANFFGAMIIYFDRPFSVGDWIRSPEKEIEGTVEEIGWRQTRIRTFDKRPLYVPNSYFASIVVENPSRMQNRRIFEHIGVRYDDMKQVKKICEDVEKMLRNHDEIDTKQTLMVNLVKFNNSSVDFMVYTFTKTIEWTKYHAIKQDVMLKIADIIDKHGAEIAFPTQTIHVPDEVSLFSKEMEVQVANTGAKKSASKPKKKAS